ncbi:single-stranded-DNA-specific exonuclease RecJ [Methanobrevibacter sp. UBA417]|uniref:single-stranded-DNA-specific exonuclease RecJ n=1 Tax=Methanobrevibacter sp. UBA417 TaxID=1915487 RepID=UPI0039B8F3BC
MDNMSLPAGMHEKYEEAKRLILESDSIQVYSHIDCDGMCAGAIISTLLDRLGKKHDLDFVNLDKLEDLSIDHDLTIFSDLGSGQPVDKNAKEDSKILILDHHPPLRSIDYNDGVDYTYLEVNPMFYGIDGSDNVSGGGLSYFLARTFDYKDLSWIGVLSAVGDMQNSKTGKLVGLNRIILKDSVDSGYVKCNSDLCLYGRETRPLFVAMAYFSDVNLPITNNRNEAIAVLDELGIPHKTDDGRQRTLCDLSNMEKGELFSELVRMMSKVVPERYVKYIPKLVSADSYDFLYEDNHTFLRDASEFSTAMNACGRNQEYGVACEILKGNRSDALDALEVVSKTHKMNLRQSIEKVTKENKIVEMENLQYFNGSGIKSEIVGTVAGMILSYGNWRKPMIGFTQISKDNQDWKVSLRCSRLLAYDGIHFGNIIREVSQSLGGNGGGHSVACGAYIPYDKKDEFLNLFNQKLEGKLDV